MSHGLIWEDMAIVEIHVVPLKFRQEAEVHFERADVSIKATQMEWRHKDGFYAARYGQLFTGFEPR